MSVVSKSWRVYWAFRNGHLSRCIEFLTKNIGSYDFDDDKALAKSAVGFYGDTLFHLACRHGWLDLVNLLIEVYGCPPDVKDKGRQTPLHYACQYGHIDIVQYLLCHHACDATAATLDHWTPLHYACRYGHMNIVEYLVSLPSLRNVDQWSILHLTCKYGHISILEYLMDKQEFTPSPKISSKEKMAELLVTACQQDHAQIVHYLLKKIISFRNMQTKACKALFFFCCKHGLLDIMKQLTSENYELTYITDSAGLLGIHYACQNGHTAIVKHLIEECGDNKNIIACDKKGLTPLHRTCLVGVNGSNADVVWYILSMPECDVLAQTDDGNTVLHFACASKEFNPQVVDILIKHGAIVSKEVLFSIQTYMHSSQLKVNESTIQSAIVSYMLKIGKCDPNIRNYAGYSPIQLAICPFVVRETLACHGQIDIFKWIESMNNKITEIRCCVSTRKLDLNQTANDGDTVLRIVLLVNGEFVAQYVLQVHNFVQNIIKNKANHTPLISAIGLGTYKMLPEDKLNNLFNFIITFVKTVRWITALAIADMDGNTSSRIYQAYLPMLTIEQRYRVRSATIKSGKELVPSKPSLVTDYAHGSVFTYTFKPGTIQQLISFCENIDKIQFKHFIIQVHSNRIKWEHKETFDCCISDQMLHLPSHPSVWLLIKICCHSHINGQEPLTMNEKNYKQIHVIDIIEVLVDSTFNGTESKEELLLAACKQSKYKLTGYLISTLSYSIPKISITIEPVVALTIIDDMLTSSRWSDSECINTMKALEANNMDVYSRCDSKGFTAFHLAVLHHRYKVTLFLLSQTKCILNVRNREGDTPVQLLISTQKWSDPECTDIIKNLMTTKQWDPNSSCNSVGDTVLHLSVIYHRYEIILYLLLQTKCNPNKRNKKGNTPVQLLISTQKWSDHDCTNIIKNLTTTKQWDPNSSCNSVGDTVLHLSVIYHRYEVTLYLLSQTECNPTKRNKKGNTPVQLLLSTQKWSDRECTDIIKNLTITKQWDPNSSCNSVSDTVLHLSVIYHRYEVILYLLSQTECNPNRRNKKGNTPVQLLIPNREWSDSECIDILRILTSNKQWDPNSICNSRGDTVLHLSVRYQRPKMIHFLLYEAKCDPNYRNLNKLTPLQLATDSVVIRDLIRCGANPENVYESFGKTVGLENPLIPPVKVFIMGNSGVGKSTLTKALMIETSLFVRAFELLTRQTVSGVDEKTAGIVPHDFESKLYGRVIFYDFAGHREFYNSHVAILQNVIQTSSPIFLIVVDLSNSKEEVERSVLYWLSFLKNNITMADCKSHVFIIGSHADFCLARGDDPQQIVSDISSLIGILPDISTIDFVGMYPIDCRYSNSSSMDELRSSLKSSCTSLRRVDTISFNAHCFRVFLLDKFRASVAVNMKDLQKAIQKLNKGSKEDVVSYLPDNILILTSVCDELNDRGHIIFLKDNDKLENSWVIIDKASLLSKVTGTIFAPNDFKEHCQIAESTGVVPLSRFVEHFPEYSMTVTSEILIGFLTHLEFCREIVDQELLEIIGKHQDSLKIVKFPESENERYFLFPGLITLEAPSDIIWKQSFDLKYYCGWIFKCQHKEQFFSSRFTQVLLLRLAFSFALIKQDVNLSIPAFQRECSIWKNGIFWGEIFGMEIIVEIYPTMVTLHTRCIEDNLINCIAQRSSIIRKIRQCAQDICSNIETVESFIDPSEATEFPLKSSVSEIPQFGLQAIVEAIIKSAEYESHSIVSSKCTISLDDLLIFEPYAELGMTLLKELCTRKNDCDKKVSNRFLQRLNHRLSRRSTLFIKMFRSNSSTSSSAILEDLFDVLKTWRDEDNGTYRCLKDKFDQFSIFAGRNDLVSVIMIVESDSSIMYFA